MAFIRAIVFVGDAYMDLRQKLGRCCEPLQHRQFFLPAGEVVSCVLRRQEGMTSAWWLIVSQILVTNWIIDGAILVRTATFLPRSIESLGPD
jgi:hypothetical protein